MTRGRPPREAASPSALAPALARWAAARGIDVVTRAGLDPGDVEHDEVAVTARTLATMLELASDGDPHVALELPATLPFRTYDAGTLAARVAATPRATLEAFARFSRLVFPRLEARVTATTDEVVLSMRIEGAPRGLGHPVDEYVLATALGHCRRGGARVTPRRVWLTSARPPGSLEPLARAFGTDEIELGCEDTGFALARGDADVRLPALDPMLVAAADRIASAALAQTPRSSALTGAVAAKIEALLPGDVSAEAMAASLKMSARTLQRRLDDEGTRYSSLLDEVRIRLAKRLLADPANPLGEIAHRVGFSDLATFSRAFKRWTGVPPGTFRRRTSPAGAAS